jgi:hypothetical protein
MADQPWKSCQYFFTEKCPNQSSISKAILIPQFLDPHETQILESACANCETCQNERRASLRIRRPLKVFIESQDLKRTAQGSVVNVSSTGALVALDDWFDFRVYEEIMMHIYTDNHVADHMQVHVDKRQSIVRRIIEDKRQIGLMFIQ